MVCRIEGCGRRSKYPTNDLCAPHHRQWLDTGTTVPLPPMRQPSPVRCTFPGCDRKAVSKGLCKPHHAQKLSGRPMHPVGDRSAINAAKRAAWQRLTEEERQARLKSSIQKPGSLGGKYVRDHEWRRRMSLSRRGRSPKAPSTPRVCFGCAAEFIPKELNQTFCTSRCYRNHSRLRVYGLTIAQEREMHERQGGVCAICHQDKPLGVDHDHATGRVRGLLCSTCNTGLGKLGDSAERLREAIAYLER